EGFQVDTGPHAITHLEVGPLKRLMDNYFDYVPVFENYGTYYSRTENDFRPVPSNLKEFIRFEPIPKKDRLIIAQGITKALTLSTFGINLSQQSVKSTLPENLSKTTKDFVNAICYFLSGKSMEYTSVHRILTGSAFVRDSITQEQFEANIGKIEGKQADTILQSVIPSKLHKPLSNKMSTFSVPLTSLGRLATNQSSSSQGYPRQGLKALLNSILQSLPNSVEIITNTEVKSFITEGKKVVGVKTDNEVYEAKTVIYTGFAKKLPTLYSKFPVSYIDKVNNIEQSKSLTIWLGLDSILDEFSYIGSEIWFKDFPYWAMPISNYDSSLAPKGKQLIGFAFIIDKNKDENEEIEKAYSTIFSAVPAVKNHIEMKHEQISVPEKGAVTINGTFADIRTPLENLYVAGTDADNRSMGITRAAYSVIELLKIAKEDGILNN
ncbi:NAD(P)/FAD-dependent oxidoreductase, partial [Methanosalsum natronophilum]